MFDGVLFLLWAFLLVIWLVYEHWLKDHTGNRTSTVDIMMAEALSADAADKNVPGTSVALALSSGHQTKERSCDECEDSMVPDEETTFNFDDLHLQLKHMESMMKVLLPYKEKLDSLSNLTSNEAFMKLVSSGGENSLTLVDLCDRLKVLESENRNLLMENGTQRMKFERCLDQVAVHVAHILIAQQTLRGECVHLHRRVHRLEQQNHELYKLFRQQIDRICQVKQQESVSSIEHVYELPDNFVSSEEASASKDVDAAPGMYDSLESEYPVSFLHYTISGPDSSQPTHSTFNIRSQTIPTYASPRSQSRFIDHQLSESLPKVAFRAQSCRSPSQDETLLGQTKVSSKYGSCRFSKAVNLDFETDVKLATKLNAAGNFVDEEYSSLLPGKHHFCESLESSLNVIQVSSTDELLKSTDSCYEQFTIDDCLCPYPVASSENKSEESPDFCLDSDETQSLIPESDHLTRASSVSLSELLGRTPNMTSDSENLSFDDYPCLDRNMNDSIIDEYSLEDSDYEELLVQDFPSAVHEIKISRMCSGSSTPNHSKEASTPSRRTLSCHLQKTTDMNGHLSALSRCSNKKLKSAADKIFSAKIKVHPTKVTQGVRENLRSLQEVKSFKDHGEIPEHDGAGSASGMKTHSSSTNSNHLCASNRGHNHLQSSSSSVTGDAGLSDRISTKNSLTFSTPDPNSLPDYVNISRLNIRHKTEPLLARRKQLSPIKSVAPVLPKRAGECSKTKDSANQKTSSRGSDVQGHTTGSRECKRNRKLFRRRQNQQNQSPHESSSESDHPLSTVLTSSSESGTITGEKLPSSQDDGYSSNSLPSESSGKLASQFSQPNPREDPRRDSTSVEIVKIVPILRNFPFERKFDRRSQRKKLQNDRIRKNLEASVDEEDEQAEPHNNESESLHCSDQHFDKEINYFDDRLVTKDVMAEPESPLMSEDETDLQYE